MSILLTPDPIVTEQAAHDVLGWASSDKVRLAINSASARFLAYTHRLRITSGPVVERQRGRGQDHFWLHASPVGAIASLQIYSGGTLSDTIDGTTYTVEAESGHVYMHGAVAPHSDGERNMVITYTGGWTTVPGDIVQSALALMILDEDRMKGRLGVSSSSQGGSSASYELDGLPKATSDVWSRYRYMA